MYLLKLLMYNLFCHRSATVCMDILMNIYNKSAVLLLIGVILTNSVTIHQALAETGKGDDIFRVIMTIFGVDKSKGDVVAIVTVNDGEASKVRFLDSDIAATGGIIEYVATFPNVTVNAAEPYEACVLPVKTLEPICTPGNNSPAARPEFVDISLNATTAALAEDELPEDGGGDEEE
jgi:hypothetical protein